MIKSFEASGKSVDEAIDRACLLAGRTIVELEIEILELGGKGFLGFGSRDARVRVSYEQPDAAPAKIAGPAATPLGGAPGSGVAPASTFGVKKSKKERFEQKSAKTKAEIEIKPIVTVDPTAGLPEELKEASRQQPRPKREGSDQQRDRYPGNRDERPARNERSNGGRPENKPIHEGRPAKDDRPPREEPSFANRPENKAVHKESRATDVTSGEMEQQVTAAALAFLQPLFVDMGVQPAVANETREGILWLSFAGENLGILIGRRGETLNSLQYLCNLAVNKHRNDHVRLVLDVEGYRQGREETLSVLAHKMADKAVKTGRRVELEPMNPHERRVVHIALQNDRRVDTVSHGEEPYRRVVISKKRTDKRPARKPGGTSGNDRCSRPAAPQDSLN